MERKTQMERQAVRRGNVGGGRMPGEDGEGLTTGLWQLPILIKVGEKQAVDEGGFPQA